MIVCVCRGVSDREIRKAVKSGSTCLDSLALELGVTTQCGRCGDCAHRILRDELRRCPGTGAPSASGIDRQTTTA